MGYYINQRGAEFSVDPDQEEGMRQALLRLPERHYSWVGAYNQDMTLDQILDEWRWTIEREDGLIVNIEFNGEKYGDDDLLMETIAPFVKDGSCIEMQGEEGEVWRWTFNDGKCKKIYAKLAWD